MSEITWQTQEQREEVGKRMAASKIAPYACLPTEIEGVWKSKHVLERYSEYLQTEYEAAGFADVSVETEHESSGQAFSCVRFRLPEPTTEAAPAPRYYVRADELFYVVCDRKRLNGLGQPSPVEALFTRIAADARVAELNTADITPVEAPAFVHPVLAELKALNVDELSPLEALTKLRALKRLL